MQNTKIEWCDSTWNPVTGCLHECEYCYARKQANRFKGFIPMGSSGATGVCYHEEKSPLYEVSEPFSVRRKNGKIVKAPYPFGFAPTFHVDRQFDVKYWKKPQTIFVCSMADLFGEWIPDEWIEEIFTACEKAPQHTYLFLTKNPKRYVELYQRGKLPIANNMWYGTSVTTPKQAENAAYWFGKMPISPKTANTFLSVEPMLADITKYHAWESICRGMYADWVIVGAETGNRKNKVIPRKEWVENIVKDTDRASIPVFMKESLVPIIGEENMRRDFPWGNDDLSVYKLKDGEQSESGS